MSSLLHFSHAFTKAKMNLTKDTATNAFHIVKDMREDLNTAFQFHKNEDKKSHKLYEELGKVEKALRKYNKKRSQYNTRHANPTNDEQKELDSIKEDVQEHLENAYKVYEDELLIIEKEFEIFEQLQDDEKRLEKTL